MIRQQLKLLFRFGACKSVALGRFSLHQDTLTLTGLPRRTLVRQVREKPARALSAISPLPPWSRDVLILFR